jgi:hypothetical protein
VERVASTEPRVRRGRLLAVVAVAAVVVAMIAARGRSAPRPTERFQRGVALGLFATDPEWDYGGMLREIRALGATDVEIAVAWGQGGLGGATIAPRAGLSPSTETLRRTLRQARALGLRVLLFPFVRVDARDPSEWRGRISFVDPAHADAWWASYGAFVEAMARLAREEGVERLSVGSELLALEAERPRWQALIAKVRHLYPGRLIYSANWDHFDGVSFWDLVDEAGVTGYFELTSTRVPSADELARGWRRASEALVSFARRTDKPLVLTEVGYPSLDGANMQPWNETRKERVDVDEQQACYEAFADATREAPFIDGVYFWNWFGVGGPNDGGYSPRGKPAAAVIERYFTQRRR